MIGALAYAALFVIVLPAALALWAPGLEGLRPTEAACPPPGRLHDLPAFVGLRGGGYFFLPGLKALAELAEPATTAAG